MKKLTKNDIDFVKIERAKSDGNTPSVLFTIKNHANVQAFLNGEDSKVLWGDVNNVGTHRLAYKVDGDELTISRNVKQSTLSAASNLTLANSVLKDIYSTDSSEAADIWMGLTGQDLDKFHEVSERFDLESSSSAPRM